MILGMTSRCLGTAINVCGLGAALNYLYICNLPCWRSCSEWNLWSGTTGQFYWASSNGLHTFHHYFQVKRELCKPWWPKPIVEALAFKETSPLMSADVRWLWMLLQRTPSFNLKKVLKNCPEKLLLVGCTIRPTDFSVKASVNVQIEHKYWKF